MRGWIRLRDSREPFHLKFRRFLMETFPEPFDKAYIEKLIKVNIERKKIDQSRRFARFIIEEIVNNRG